MGKQEEVMYSEESDLEKDISFDVSKEVRVSTKVTFKKGDVIETLIKRIKELELKVNSLGHGYSQDALSEIWSNEYDQKWDEV